MIAPSARDSFRRVMLLTTPVKSSFKKDSNSITAAVATDTG